MNEKEQLEILKKLVLQQTRILMYMLSPIAESASKETVVTLSSELGKLDEIWREHPKQ